MAVSGLGDAIADPAWAAHLAPTVAIQAVIAWLDAGQPAPEGTAERIRTVLGAVLDAAGHVTSS